MVSGHALAALQHRKSRRIERMFYVGVALYVKLMMSMVLCGKKNKAGQTMVAPFKIAIIRSEKPIQ